jgi:hypothetical protein
MEVVVNRIIPLAMLAAAFALTACGPPRPVLDVPAPEADPVPDGGPERGARPRMEAAGRTPADTAFRAPRPEAAILPSQDRFASLVLRPVRLEYAVMVEGETVGTTVVELAREQSVWTSAQTVEAGPLRQHTEVRFTEALVPLGYLRRVQGAGVPADADVRVEEGRFLGTTAMPPAGERTVDAPVGDALLAGMERWILAGWELAPGRSVSIPVFDPDRGESSDLIFLVTGEEEVTVPAGTFRAYRVEVSGLAGPTHVLHVRAEAPHVVLRQATTDQPFTVELQRLP